MTEDEYILIVEHAQRAIAGDVKAVYAVVNMDMVQMFAAYREHEREVERLRAALKVHHDLGLWSLGHETCPECGQTC
jgi:hypothetical protein